MREVPIYWAQGSHIVWNFREVFVRMLESFSWAIIHETFLFTALNEGLGCFQALAMDILVPSNIKLISVCVALEIPGTLALRIATSGDLGIWQVVTL